MVGIRFLSVPFGASGRRQISIEAYLLLISSRGLKERPGRCSSLLIMVRVVESYTVKDQNRLADGFGGTWSLQICPPAMPAFIPRKTTTAIT
jgi:hypothetical protein